MAKRRDDYRITRAGAGARFSEIVADTFEGLCPNCQTKCEQQKVEKFAPNGKKAYQLRCSNCGFKRFKEYVDRSNYKSPEAKKGRLIQVFQEFLWDWMMEHFEEIMTFQPPHKINLFRGKVGSPRRHKNKPFFSSNELHPDFIKYLDTPEYIKRLSQALKDLGTDDPQTCDFILFRAMGYSFQQMDAEKHFALPLTKPIRKSRSVGHGSLERTEYSRTLNRRATAFLIASIPEDLLNTFVSKDALDAALSTVGQGGKYTASRDDFNGNERVTCPKCGGKDKACSLCSIGRRAWDGTIPVWLEKKYQEKIARGDTWD